jgi:hypothetical protein
MARTSKTCMSAATFVLTLLLTSGWAAQAKPRVTGFYSDMQYIKEAGDVVGMEVWIVYARGSYWATVQLADGEPDVPVVVPVLVSGQRVGFTLTEPSIRSEGKPEQNLVLKFDGTATNWALTGVFGTEHVTLKRGNSYW